MISLYKYYIDADYRFRVNERLGFYRHLSDKVFLEKKFRAKLGYELDLNRPITFNEKLQWLKLHDRNPLYTKLVDKYAVKQWVASCIGEQYVVPTYGVWDSFDDIDFDRLPERFVLKCTHDSGGIAVCRNRATFDFNAARVRIESLLKCNYYWLNREWPYKDVRPRIIAEQYLSPDPITGEVSDYRFTCFGGLARCVLTPTGRARGDLRVDFYDPDWKHLRLEQRRPNADIASRDLTKLAEMRSLVERLSEAVPHVRNDFYDVAGEPRFVEMTFRPGLGLKGLFPEILSETLGNWTELPFGGVFINDDWLLWIHEEATSDEDPYGENLADYKFYRFTDGGIITLVCEDRHLGKGMSETYYDEDWNMLELTEGSHPIKARHSPPPHFEEMKDIAYRLGEGMPFVRVDCYEGAQRPLFGELTFYPAAGFKVFNPPVWDVRLGERIDLTGAYGS